MSKPDDFNYGDNVKILYNAWKHGGEQGKVLLVGQRFIGVRATDFSWGPFWFAPGEIEHLDGRDSQMNLFS